MITENDQGNSVSTAFDSALQKTVQKIRPKVLAEWKNSRSLDNVSVSAVPDYTTAQKLSGNIGDYFDVRQVANGWNRQGMTWGVVGDLDVDGLPIRADGTWHTLPEKNGGSHEFGWRSPTATNSSGVYATAPVITMTFNQEKINYIEIYTSEYSGAIKEYTLEYLDSAGSYQSVVANHVLSKGTSSYRHTLSSGNTIDIKGARLTIHKTQNGNDYARVNEINPIYETDISEYIIRFSCDKNRDIHDTTLPLGGISANSFTMSIDNSQHHFTVGSNLKYGSYLAKDIKFVVSLGWRTTTSPDEYEYVNCGTYWADEWKQLTNMTMDVQCRDYTRFLTDAEIEGGFIVSDSDAANALRILLSTNNFPRADFQGLYPYQKAVLEDGAVAHYRFNEGVSSGSVSAGSSSITPGSGLLARWWTLGDLSGDSEDLRRALFRDDRTVQSNILGLGGKELIDYSKSPRVTENSSTNSVSGYAVNYTNRNPGSQADFYHTVVDGFFIPPSTDDYQFKITVKNGGFRLFLGGSSSRYVFDSASDSESARRDLELFKGELRIDKFFNNQSSVSFQTDSVRLYQNNPISIRIEAFHVMGDFELKLERKIGSGSYAAVSPSETLTDVAFDVVGSRDDYIASNNYSSLIRNHGIYSGSPLLRQSGGISSDSKDFSVKMDNTDGSNDYMTIAYDSSIDLTSSSGSNYTGSFSIEAFVNFTSYVSGQGVYAGNLDNATSGTGTKGVGLFFKSSGHGVKFINNSGTMQEASVSTGGDLDEWVHVVATYDGTDLKYYFNGELKDTITSVGAPAAWSSQDFLVGKSTYGSSSSNAYLRGKIDEFAIYRKALTSDQVRDHYYITTMDEIRVHPYLYGEKSAFQIAGDIATGDLGMFYFDEFGKFRYDHFSRLYESGIPQHATSQATISDSVNIKSAERRIELLANKVTIVVNPMISKNIGLSPLWRPPDPTSLTVTKLASGSSVTSAETSQIFVDSTSNPPWKEKGYFKINDEIIKYDKLDENYFKTLTRAQFGTTAAAHSGGDKVREVRYFQFSWSQSPAVDIKAPFIAAVEFEDPDLVSVDRFIKKPYGGEVVMSATTNLSVNDNIGDVVFLEGTNAYSGVMYFTSISGTAISNGGSSSKVSRQSSIYSDSMRKYGKKEVVIDNRFVSDDDYAQDLADFLINKMESGVPILDVDVLSMPKLQLGDRITISRLEQLGISNKDYWVVESKIEYNGGVSQRLTLREAS